MNKIFQSLVVVLVVSFSISTFLVPPAKAAEDFWTTKAQMPTARAGFGVAAVNGKVYAIGGSNGSWLNTNEEYDPATDTWTTKTQMPTKRGYVATAVYQNKIYVIGGDSYESSPSGKTEVYDPATDTWETKTSMPTPRENLCANVVNGKIYLIAGNTFNTLAWPVLSNKTEVYDPSTDSWTTKASIPNFEGLGFADIASAAVNNKIYVIGGEEQAITDLNQIYDPETDTWNSGTSMPTAVEGPAAGATTGVFAPKRIHVLSMDLHHVYDPETDVWSTGTQMPTPRRHLGVAVINDRLYAIGGGFSGDFGFIETNKNEQYTPSGYAAVNGPIIIRSDGSVVGTDKIQRDGNVYTFTSDIFGSIVVEKHNIVVDGAGYTLQGVGSGVGLNLTVRSNVTIKNMEVEAFEYGIWLENDSKNNSISANNITNNDVGISVKYSLNNSIFGNELVSNGYGIWLFQSSDNVIFGNNITNNYYGIKLGSSSNNAFCENNITHNQCGIWLAYSIKNSSVSGNNVKNNFCGIYLEDSSANIISANNIISNSYGIHGENSPNNNVSLNNITSNQYGIVLRGSATYRSGENIVYGNNITNNDFGIQVISPGNSIYYNNFINNTKQAYTDIYSLFTANYWSDYAGKDRNGDNIGDTPYGDYLDRYPLMRPWTLGWSPKPSVDQAPEEEIPFWMQWWFWTIIAVVIVTLAGTVYLKKRKPPITTVSPLPSEGIT